MIYPGATKAIITLMSIREFLQSCYTLLIYWTVHQVLCLRHLAQFLPFNLPSSYTSWRPVASCGAYMYVWQGNRAIWIACKILVEPGSLNKTLSNMYMYYLWADAEIHAGFLPIPVLLHVVVWYREIILSIIVFLLFHKMLKWKPFKCSSKFGKSGCPLELVIVVVLWVVVRMASIDRPCPYTAHCLALIFRQPSTLFILQFAVKRCTPPTTCDMLSAWRHL